MSNQEDQNYGGLGIGAIFSFLGGGPKFTKLEEGHVSNTMPNRWLEPASDDTPVEEETDSPSGD